jgi:exodeoxyribonuclease VII large subunit
LYGFSVNVMAIQPAGEGSIKRAAQLLRAKLAAEGLFDEDRKRVLPYPPARIGLITSKQSAAYADFIKILKARWQGIDIQLVDVQVQGEPAPGQIAAAIEQLNSQAELPEAIVIIRGGGSAEDLAAFNAESVTRAVAASRAPTLVAIGHEVDLSLAELAADRRASTPSNAAELLVPDRARVLAELKQTRDYLRQAGQRQFQAARDYLDRQTEVLERHLRHSLDQAALSLRDQSRLLAALDPSAILRRGYAIVRQAGRPVRATAALNPGAIVDVQISDGGFTATVKAVNKLKGKR